MDRPARFGLEAKVHLESAGIVQVKGNGQHTSTWPCEASEGCRLSQQFRVTGTCDLEVRGKTGKWPATQHV